MKLVLFCDYGLDDAVATCDVFSRGGFSSYDVVPIGGNVPTEIALKNAKKLLASLSLPQGVRIVDTTKIAQPAEFLQEIHGGDGMGDVFEEIPCALPVVDFDEWLTSLNEQFVLVSLGPMTMVKEVLACKKPQQFIFMGGNIAEAPNFNGYEFNHGVNLSAFADCVSREHIAITMDTCRNPLLNVQKDGVRGDTLMHRLVNRSRELTFTSGEKGCYIWDDMAIKYLYHPEWFEVEERTDKDGNVLSVAKYIYGKPYDEIILE